MKHLILLFIFYTSSFILPASAAVIYSSLINEPIPLSMNRPVPR
ncbi:MAG: hypothetical protein NTV80_07125 [Verrucomicrobia bacterium]|nr:hypothetical protein [Verrucomicrobiota bacterium]